jgi:pantetheine-phosphate adenylyltransferase
MHCVYPGSFDPPTFGHLSLIERAVSLFEKLTIVVGENPDKKTLFSADERKNLLESLVAKYNNVEVVVVSGLLVNYVKTSGADFILKGIRNNNDLSSEQVMAETNKKLSGIETLFMPCEGKFQYISSSLVRQVHSMDGNIDQFVPQKVCESLMAKK